MQRKGIIREEKVYTMKGGRKRKKGDYSQVAGLLHLTQISLGFPSLVLVARKLVPLQSVHRRISPSSCSPVNELQSLLNALATLYCLAAGERKCGSNVFAVLRALAACAA